ncbi:MAG: sigma-70 family RNA polymerase sigma factor [Woeseia sp.]
MNSSADFERRRRFDRVVTVFHTALYRYAAWLCRDRDIAEVVVQESLLRAWKSLDALREDEAAKRWLLTIVRRENARYFERKKLDMVDIDDLSPSQAAMIADSGNPELDEVREAIYRLDDDYREPLLLQVLMGYSAKEIADLMGIKTGTVLTRLHRARLKLKETLNAAGCAHVVRDNG